MNWPVEDTISTQGYCADATLAAFEKQCRRCGSRCSRIRLQCSMSMRYHLQQACYQRYPDCRPYDLPGRGPYSSTYLGPHQPYWSRPLPTSGYGSYHAPFEPAGAPHPTLYASFLLYDKLTKLIDRATVLRSEISKNLLHPSSVTLSEFQALHRLVILASQEVEKTSANLQ